MNCSKNAKKLCSNDECKICFERSFASHTKNKFFSPKNGVTARQAFKNSNNKYIFDCDVCKHEFTSMPKSINGRNDWCPYCSSSQLCSDEDCAYCFDNSFQSHEKSIQFSVKNNVCSRQLTRSSGKKYLFNCNICNHEFVSSPNDVSSGYWCPYCSSTKLCLDTECKWCFNKSFASIEKSKYWSNKNELLPRQVFKSSNKVFIFVCEKNHEFISNPNSISQGKWWCPQCVNKTEGKLFEHLKLKYNISRQFKPNWCKNLETNKHLPFDFVIEDLKIIIELDGRQHFEQVSNWESPEETQRRDKYKMKCANDFGYSVIRIFQEDVADDKNNWDKLLSENIRIYELPVNIFISSGNHYDVYKN